MSNEVDNAAGRGKNNWKMSQKVQKKQENRGLIR
jgi:hypothetical protein